MSNSLREWWFTLQAWWQELTPDSQGYVRDAAVMLGALLVGQILGPIVGRRLRAHEFDASLRAPWLPAANGLRVEARPFAPTGLVSGLVRVTAWGAGVWWLAKEHDWATLARTLEWAAGRAWSLAAVLVVALFLARYLAGQVIEILQSPPLSEKLDRLLPRSGGGREPRTGGVPALAGTAVYSVAFLLVLLVASDLFGWALAGSAAAAAWSLFLNAIAAGTAVLIGWLGYRWAQSLTVPETEAARPVHYAALAIMTGSTLLAIAVLAATLQGVIGVVFVLILAFALWPLRGYVSDVWAGFLLKGQKVENVRLDGELSRVEEVGLLTTRLHRQDEQLTRRNRLVMDAHLQGTSKTNGVAPVSRDEIGR